MEVDINNVENEVAQDDTMETVTSWEELLESANNAQGRGYAKPEAMTARLGG